MLFLTTSYATILLDHSPWSGFLYSDRGWLVAGRQGAGSGWESEHYGWFAIDRSKETSYPTKRRCEVCQEMRLIIAKIGPLSIKEPCPNQCGRGRDVMVRLTGVESKTAVGNVVPVRN